MIVGHDREACSLRSPPRPFGTGPACRIGNQKPPRAFVTWVALTEPYAVSVAVRVGGSAGPWPPLFATKTCEFACFSGPSRPHPGALAVAGRGHTAIPGLGGKNFHAFLTRFFLDPHVLVVRTRSISPNGGSAPIVATLAPPPSLASNRTTSSALSSKPTAFFLPFILFIPVLQVASQLVNLS